VEINFGDILRAAGMLIVALVWLYMFLKLSKDLGYLRAMTFANFVASIVDIVLFFTPLRTTLASIYIYNKYTHAVILRLDITLTWVLILKSVMLWLVSDFLPKWFSGMPRPLTIGGGRVGKGEEG